MKAIDSIPDADGLRCVDILQLDDGRYAFKEFRRDPEDRGRWTPVHDYSAVTFASREEALQAATQTIEWFRSAG